MDTSTTGLLRTFLPRVPFLLKTAICHSLSLSPTSSKWDLRTELTIRLLRSILDNPRPVPIGKQQRFSLRDPGIRGKMWIAKTSLPAPEEVDLRDLLLDAVDSMMGAERGHYPVPKLSDVEAEWTGWRSGVGDGHERENWDEKQHWKMLMGEVKNPVTILYLHGGAHFMMDPASHRIPVSRLAHLTDGRCLSVRYRLSPQNPFPCALLDIFQTYISLLYPSPGSFHDAVDASNIVFAGDSAGGGLGLALVQLLLQINRSSSRKSISFHGRSVPLPLPLPAGCAGNSAWIDSTRCMPSVVNNAQYDYLPPVMSNEAISRFPSDAIWPTDPPRGDLYCELSMLCHPLVSPLAAKDWSGSCPLWFAYGQEMLADEGRFVASLAAKQGVTVVWEQYEAMPHCFSMIIEQLETARGCFKNWGSFCARVAGAENWKEAGRLESSGKWVLAKTCEETQVDVKELAVMTPGDVERKMRETQQARRDGLEGEGKLLPKL
ncbi:MAG: hypothetical protein LQ351_003123 [Letrouitia transgressa]|nr:MAG: hypothetical protein LQ351_003123 [Letrouitia transgressa]